MDHEETTAKGQETRRMYFAARNTAKSITANTKMSWTHFSVSPITVAETL
jgi:hypothetical protein